MLPSSRTPEGYDNHCPICGQPCCIDPTIPPGDAPCPHCGSLLWFEGKPAPSLHCVSEAIRVSVRRLVELKEAGISWEGIVREVTHAVTYCTAAFGAAVWRCGEAGDRMEFDGVPAPFGESAMLTAIRRVNVESVRRSGIPAGVGHDQLQATHLPHCCLLYVPVIAGVEIVAVLELVQRPQVMWKVQQGMLQFLQQMAEILATHRDAAALPTTADLPGYEAMSALEESLEAMEFRGDRACSLDIRVSCSTSAELESKLRQVRDALDEWSFRRGKNCGTLSLTVALPRDFHDEFCVRWDSLLQRGQDDEPFWAWLSLVSAKISLADEDGVIVEEMPLDDRWLLVPTKPWWQFW